MEKLRQTFAERYHPVTRAARPQVFAEILTEEPNVYLAIERWLGFRPRVKLEFGRDETNSYWVVKVAYNKAFMMVGDETLLNAVVEAAMRIERVSDGH